MVDRLELHSHASGSFSFLRDRLYVARTLVPPGYEAYFRRRAKYRSVQTSTAIEGNELGEEQAMLVLVEDAQPESPDEIEVKNLDEAYDLIQQIASDRSVRIDEGLIRTMNSVMLKGLPDAQARSRGRYRAGTSLIINSHTREIRYRPPQAERVAGLMAGFVEDIQGWMAERTYEGPEIAALAHFGLISIHPFDDGNGRTARLLADMILYQTGWSNEGMISVSEAILQRQADYYDVLRETQGDGFINDVDVTPFVEFHTQALELSAIDLEKAVVNFNRRRDAFVEYTKGWLNQRQALGLMFMLDVAPLSTSSFAELVGASQSSAWSDLKEMIDRGLVKRVGQGRSTRYRAADTIVAFGDELAPEPGPNGETVMVNSS